MDYINKELEKMSNKFITGYFARVTENGHNAKRTQVHVFNRITGKCLCRYKPHKTMKMQWCAIGIFPPYIECEVCKNKTKAN